MLEVFSGSGRISNAFRAGGWNVRTIDLYYNSDLMKDVLELTRRDITDLCKGIPDFIWLSPPCQAFSVSSIGKHWGGGFRAYIPISKTAEIGLALVSKCIEIISWYPNIRYAIENPRGVLRKLSFVKELPRYTITYCQYGEKRMKPTDIWTNLKTWIPRSVCHNGDLCHVAAPRGSRTGTQGFGTVFDRGILPEQLCEEIFSVVNNEVK
jgi:hypothetical protein